MASILHVGDDLTFRIPVMERAGFSVCRTGCSVENLQKGVSSAPDPSALVFHADVEPIPSPVLNFANTLCSPLIFFDSAIVVQDHESFDLVIPVLTPPWAWLECLNAAIEYSKTIQNRSRQLLKEAAVTRSECQKLRSRLHRLRTYSLDIESIWRSEPD